MSIRELQQLRKQSQLDQRSLKKLLLYDPDAGVFRWKTNRNGVVRSGDVAGTAGAQGYRMVHVQGFFYSAHRLAYLYMTGEWPAGQVDHINHDRSDNRWSNLRIVNMQQNCRNRALTGTNKTGCLGVHWHSSRKAWVARISHDGRRKFLGRFKDISDAIAARKDAEKQFGYHENHGCQ